MRESPCAYPIVAAVCKLSRQKERLRVVVSTPNIFHPPAFLRDATHITPWCYDELGGIAKLAGFKVSMIYRLYHDALLKKFIRRYLGYPIFRMLGIDFAKQILLVAEKPAVN